MNNSSAKKQLGRVVAAGLGLALAGGMSLVAVAPASAESAPYRQAVNIEPTSIEASGDFSSAQWFVQQGSADKPFKSVSGGLELKGTSGIAQGLGVVGVDVESLRTAIAAGGLGWATTADSAPASLQVVLDARSAGANGGGTVVLSAAAPTDGDNVVTLDSEFTTNGPITRSDKDETVAEFAAGDTAPLKAFLEADGVYNIVGFGISGTATDQNSIVTSATWPYVDSQANLFITDFTFLTPSKAGTAKITGSPVVGKTLTVSTAGWPEGTTFTYGWGWNGGQMGGEIEGATKSTYTITSEFAGRYIMAFVTGTQPGLAPVTVRTNQTAMVPVAKKPTAAAPASDTASLTTYLTSMGVKPQTQKSVGLPDDQLDASQDHTAKVAWSDADSFVDAYLYSTPTKIGTFPVVDGKVQIVLTAEVLSALDSASHTLVITGQSSGAVQAVAINVDPATGINAAALAATGADVFVPLSAAVVLLLAGGMLLLVRRRRQGQQA